MKIIGITILILLSCGCSNQATYEALQQGQRNECEKLPQGQYEDCMREADVPYGQYERERQEAIKAHSR